jgi:hypothetical protein
MVVFLFDSFFFSPFLSLFFSQDTFDQQVMAIVEERKTQRRFGKNEQIKRSPKCLLILYTLIGPTPVWCFI